MDNIESKINIVKKQLQEYGWEYVVDRFTNSEWGHRRERFERIDTFYKDFLNLERFDIVLIFHYKNDGKYNEPSIQTYSNVPKPTNEYLDCSRKECCGLQIKEMELFFEFMKLIKQKDKLLEKKL